MFFYEGLSCPACGRAFTETDDIVACPECGAPHHRACWQKQNGCACAAEHGTDRQWSRERAQGSGAEQRNQTRCPNCGAENPAFAEFCSHCGRELPSTDWHSANHTGQTAYPNYNADNANTAGSAAGNPGGFGGYSEYMPFHAPAYDPCGGVPPEELIEGERAADLAAVTRTNSTYYVPRFQRMARQGSRVSWNWPAFLIPSYWLLYRKQYAAGGLLLLFEFLQAAISTYVQYTYFAAAMAATSYAEMLNRMLALMQEGNGRVAVMLLAMLAVTELLLRICIGLFGNRLYMRHCLSVVQKARKDYPEGYRAQLTMVGGTSVVLPIIAYMALQITVYVTAYLLL